MAELISGPTMVLNWLTGSGTITLAADYRTCTWSPIIAYVDASAGSDTQVARLTALKDATASVTLVMQTAGTIIGTALAAGVVGTLVIQPEGTAVGKRKITFPAYADGASLDFPYADVAVISCGFTGAGSVLNNYSETVN